MSEVERFYGGSILAMVGKGCVSIISDKRLGMSSFTVSKNFSKIFKISDRIYIGFCGLYSDAQMIVKELLCNYDLKKLEKGRELEPEEFSESVSYLLYSKRTMPYFVSVVVAGISRSGEPYITGMDCVGCKEETGKFVTAGTARNNLSGVCEAVYVDDMGEEDLFVASVQAFLNSVDRDALSGWGADCYIINNQGFMKRTVKGRCD